MKYESITWEELRRLVEAEQRLTHTEDILAELEGKVCPLCLDRVVQKLT